MPKYLFELRSLEKNQELRDFLAFYVSVGGVLDFAPFECAKLPSALEHRIAATEAMALFDGGQIDDSKLIGRQIEFTEFWGTDDITPNSNVDGYKTAFFHPPYGMRVPAGQVENLFEIINTRIFGPQPNACTIYSWSTDWSDYFDAGREWWGTYFWTIHSPDTGLLTAIGGSTTD